MNLLIVTEFWPSVSNTVSGIFVVQQVAAFSRFGCRVTVIVPVSFGKMKNELCSISELNLDEKSVNLIKIAVLRWPERLSFLPGSIHLNTTLCGFSLGRHIRRLSRQVKFDGCIIHGIRYGGISMPMWYRQINGRSVMVMHGVDPYMMSDRNQRRARSLYLRAGEVCSAVVLVGQPLRKHALSWVLDVEKIHVVSNGTDLPPISQVNSEQRVSADVRRLVSVSNLVPLKGIDYNLRALAFIADSQPEIRWEYRVIGDGPYRCELEKMAVELGIESNVTFLGRISYPATMQEIENSDIFSLPSWGEAFGITYLEAMARGRPVVGCWRNGAQDIVTHGVDGILVEPKDVDSLSSALVDLLSSPEKCSKLGLNARATSENFSWDKNALRMLRVVGWQDER